MMINDIKKNELNEREMDNVTGGAFSEPGDNVQKSYNDPGIPVGEYLYQEAYDIVSEPFSMAEEVVTTIIDFFG